jgi:hypothetical protein
MNRNIMTKNRVLARFLPLLILPVFFASVSQAQDADPAHPGTINYVEGSVAIDHQAVTQQAIGSAALDPGQVLTTEHGRAEVLLTPGIFFRLDNNSAVTMVSPDLTKTVVELNQGRALVEVDQIYKQNDVQVLVNGRRTQLLKVGLYEFNAAKGDVQVFDGKAAVQEQGDKWEAVKGNHELALADGTNLKPHDFDANAGKDDLYNWSSLRSNYLAQAGGGMTGNYENPGWYWDPYAYGYAFFGPYPYWSPFGFYGGFYGGGFYGRGFYGRGFYGRGFYGGSGYYGGHAFGGGGFHGGGGGRR